MSKKAQCTKYVTTLLPLLSYSPMMDWNRCQTQSDPLQDE